jgi:hypothetical protein
LGGGGGGRERKRERESSKDKNVTFFPPLLVLSHAKVTNIFKPYIQCFTVQIERENRASVYSNLLKGFRSPPPPPTPPPPVLKGVAVLLPIFCSLPVHLFYLLLFWIFSNIPTFAYPLGLATPSISKIIS